MTPIEIERELGVAEPSNLLALAAALVESVEVDADDGSMIFWPEDLPEWAWESLEHWYPTIVLWWRSSPSAIIACDQCGEVRLVGKRPGKAGKKCGRRVKVQKPRNVAGKSEAWHPVMGCADGVMHPVDLPLTKKRPNARKVKR